MIKDLFRESSDERVELINNKIAAKGFYLFFIVLAINNVYKSFVLELDRSYWIDTHLILLGVGGMVAIMAIRSGVVGFNSYTKTEMKSFKKKSVFYATLGYLYYNLMSSDLKLSDGPITIISILVVTFIAALVAYGIVHLLEKRAEKKSI